MANRSKERSSKPEPVYTNDFPPPPSIDSLIIQPTWPQVNNEQLDAPTITILGRIQGNPFHRLPKHLKQLFPQLTKTSQKELRQTQFVITVSQDNPFPSISPWDSSIHKCHFRDIPLIIIKDHQGNSYSPDIETFERILEQMADEPNGPTQRLTSQQVRNARRKKGGASRIIFP